MQLREYQEKCIIALSHKIAEGSKKLVFQLSTGGGKTIIFSSICNRYIKKNDKSVLILVHRKELLQQARRTIYNTFNISAQPIVAGMRVVPKAKVYIGMVESTIKRLNLISNIGMVIIDEAHIHTLNKVHSFFPNEIIIGFTATPLSSNKATPMNKYYEDIICGIDVPELISMGHLAQNITYAPRDVVDRAALTIKGSDFDEEKMSLSFSLPKYINNTVSAYQKWGERTKTIIFNCNIAHSRAVNNAFIIAGYNSRHLDGTMSDTERANILKWYANTHDAILNNVAVLTAGFDEPTIETVIMNKATCSMPLWVQCTGRGGRITDNKSAFVIIDMGGNALTHGDWCDKRDWKNIFFNPKKGKKKDGVSPVKNCPQCEAIIPASSRFCNFCGYEYPEKKSTDEKELGDFIVVTKGIDVLKVINDNNHLKVYYPFFKIGKEIALNAKKTFPKITEPVLDLILNSYYQKIKEWCDISGKNFNLWHKERAKDHLIIELKKGFPKWEPLSHSD